MITKNILKFKAFLHNPQEYFTLVQWNTLANPKKRRGIKPYEGLQKGDNTDKVKASNKLCTDYGTTATHTDNKANKSKAII